MASNKQTNQNKRKVNKQWSKDEIKLLISEFETRQDLWDPARPNYSDRVKKQKMLGELGEILGVSAQEVSAKIHSLRTQFNRECAREKKTKSGSSSNENYVSKWEHMGSLQFLKIDAVHSVTTSNLNVVPNYDMANEVVSEMETIVLNSDSSDTQSEYSEASSSSGNKRHRLPTVSSKKFKKRNIDESNDDTVLEKALAVISQPNDEFDIFGQFVASEMRQISDLSIRNLVKTEIMKILLNSSNVIFTTNTIMSQSPETNDFSNEYIVFEQND